MDVNVPVPESGDGQVKDMGGHLNPEDERDQVLNNIRWLDLDERPCLSSNLCSSEGGQVPASHHNAEVEAKISKPVASEVSSEHLVTQRTRISGSSLQSTGVDRRGVKKRWNSRPAEIEFMHPSPADGGTNEINDAQALKGKDSKGRLKPLPELLKHKEANLLGSEDLQPANQTQQTQISRPHAGTGFYFREDLLRLSTNVDDDVDVIKKAAELEAAQELRAAKHERDPKSLEPLEWMLDEVFNSLQPTEDDYMRRHHVIERLNNLVRVLDTCQGVEVVPFGSFESNFYTAWGDLDLSLEFPVDQEVSPTFTKSKKVKVLRSIERVLARSGVAWRLQLIAHARVPLLMFVDSELKISCDVSVDNGTALYKSRVLRWITDMDPRCRRLIFLVKCWAKAQCINDPKLGTLNSYALSLLVVFHLQTRSPPILPPFKTLLGEHTSMPVAGKLNKDAQLQQMDECYGRIQALIGEEFGQDNKSSLGDLFFSFFGQFASVKSLWPHGLAVSTYWGEWGDSTTTNPAWNRKQYAMRVEDPFDRMDNCARSIQDISLPIICDTFAAAFEALLQPPDWNKLPSLRNLLFCWPPGTPRPGIHLRHFPVSDPGGWRSKTEIRAERRGKEQVKVPKKDRRADKAAEGKLKEPRSSANSSDTISPGLVPMLEGETGSFLLRESEDSQESSHHQVPDFGGLGTPASDTSQGVGSSNQTGGFTIMQALGLGPQEIMTPEAGLSSSVDEQGAVLQTRRAKKVNKASKKMGPEQWGLSAVQYAQSQHLQPSSNSGETGTLTASNDNELGETRQLPGSKKQTKSEGSWKSRAAGPLSGNYDCVRSSGVPSVQQSIENTERIRQESVEGPSEAFQQGAESSQTESNWQSNDLSRQLQYGPQRFSRNSSLNEDCNVPSRKPRWRPRRYNKRQSNTGVDQGRIDPGYMEHVNNRSLPGRQGILTPELCAGGPSTQRD
ncbi:hypothetical protein KC19_7G171200 [Ceratodon purpureus]|uniref:Poly(A) RNA polymerase mitochondrial-like central palm domain-containing protein n=1 Tax=Ceratodon purpureus TaxID=3225 RepID=A0A8T0H923_CERPU|nr:hypothetical protein KC19_7G171200 [Ceratodon purpureus]